jgi:hypothetical protein
MPNLATALSKAASIPDRGWNAGGINMVSWNSSMGLALEEKLNFLTIKIF